MSGRNNTEALQAAPRCNAKTRRGSVCRGPCIRGKKRCRLHGGATGSGAQKGNRNARKHGRYAKATLDEARRLREAYALLREGLKEFE